MTITIDETQLRPYETRIAQALATIIASGNAWRAVGLADAPAPTSAESAQARAASRLLWQHISEAGRQTGIPPSTLRRWCAERCILSEKRGRDWFVDVDDAIFWRDTLNERRAKSQSERRQSERRQSENNANQTFS